MNQQGRNSNDVLSSRKEREDEFRRNLVLEAAEALFAERGYEGTTVADIARRSELAKGSLYQLFQSKEEIFEAIINRKMTDMLDKLDEIIAGDVSPVEKVRMVIRSKLRAFWESRDFARIFLKELQGFHWLLDSGMLKKHKEQAKTFQARVEQILVDGQEAGELRRDVASGTLLATLGGVTNGVIIRWLQHPDSLDFEEAVHKVEEIFLHGVAVNKE